MGRGFVAVIAAAVIILAASSSAHAAELVLIVNPERNSHLRLPDIVQIYLKQRRFWPDGGAIIPVNREAGSPVRERFARRVFGEESRSLIAYWNREYFRGVLPPITLASDRAIRRFVATEPRAIGYISADMVDDSVRVAYRFE